MASKFSQIPIGSIFEAKGAKYRKSDDLYYEDLSTGFLSVWSPIFDGDIGSSTPETPKAGEPEFVTDPQTRMQKRNPKFGVDIAAHWFGEMWGSGEFDCGPEDYEWMALTAIAAVRALKAIPVATIVVTEEPQVYKAVKKKKVKAKATAAKKAVKKPTKKSTKKTARKK